MNQQYLISRWYARMLRTTNSGDGMRPLATRIGTVGGYLTSTPLGVGKAPITKKTQLSSYMDMLMKKILTLGLLYIARMEIIAFRSFKGFSKVVYHVR